MSAGMEDSVPGLGFQVSVLKSWEAYSPRGPLTHCMGGYLLLASALEEHCFPGDTAGEQRRARDGGCFQLFLLS